MKISTLNKSLSLDTPQVMGILNTTPDSFSDGGSYTELELALNHAREMIDAGATIIDVGGESTRPGAPEVSIEEELRRVVPIIHAIREFSDVWISIDTSKAQVMEAAIQAGADLINDIRALREPGALDVAAKYHVPVCIMHMQGQPRTMQHSPNYENDDVLADVDAFLAERIDACVQAGVARENIILDPGFGFGKTIAHNYHLLANLEHFHHFSLPILAGMSRKSMIYKALDKTPNDIVVESVTCASIAAMKGAQIIRVHDVEETAKAMQIVKLVQQNKSF